MSCMTPAADGTRISIDDPEAKAFRASVIEWLMINHPHDCPVCDEGRRVPPSGHDPDDRPQLPAVPLQQADLPRISTSGPSSITR